MRRNKLKKTIVWTAEKSNRLYDYVAEQPHSHESFFGYQVNKAIFNLSKYFLNVEGDFRYLDYGCGGGYLLERFLKECKDIEAYGVDMSPKCVKWCNEKFSANKNFNGVKLFDGNKLPFDSNYFDFITATEVIEHILPEHKDLFYSEIRRILKPDGILLLTTPNEEDFSKNSILCPECNTLFHKHGHCNYFSKVILTNLLDGYGFTTISCAATDFYLFQQEEQSRNLLDYSVYFLCYKLQIRLKKFWRNLNQKNWDNDIRSDFFQERIGKGYNLFYVGKK